MTRKVLVTIDRDPTASAKPAEALRVAAGLAAWRSSEIAVRLVGPGAALLERDGSFLGEDDIRAAWPVLVEAGVGVYSDRMPPPGESNYPAAICAPPGQMARLAIEADCLIRL